LGAVAKVRWLPWLAAVVAFLIGYLWPRAPQVVERTKIETREVTRWRSSERIEAGRDATTTIRPGGEVEIRGPVVFSRSIDGGTDRTTTASSTTRPAASRFAMAGPGLSLAGGWRGAAMLGMHMGPIRVAVMGTGPDWAGYGMVGVGF